MYPHRPALARFDNECMNKVTTTADADTLPSMLVVDDDVTFCRVLAAALEKRGFAVRTAHNVETAYEIAAQEPPEFVVLDLKMPGESGLTLVQRLKDLDSHTRIVILTGYASVATAVEAIKLGATHYLTKPADADEIVQAFWQADGNADVPIGDQRPSVDRLEWEYIQQVLNDCDGNISATARTLGMHRRTLQRKLQKRPVKR
jgi:two-component system response regulator RegA